MQQDSEKLACMGKEIILLANTLLYFLPKLLLKPLLRKFNIRNGICSFRWFGCLRQAQRLIVCRTPRKLCLPTNLCLRSVMADWRLPSQLQRTWPTGWSCRTGGSVNVQLIYGAVGHLSATGLPSTHDRTWCQGNVRHCDDALRYWHQNISLRMRKIPRVSQQAHKGISATVEFPFFFRPFVEPWEKLPRIGAAGGNSRRFADSLWPVRTDRSSFVLSALQAPQLWVPEILAR